MKTTTCCPVVELRQYSMNPGRRDDLIALFDEHLIEGQERYGMRVIGQYRDLNKPDHFVWIRGFADMDARRIALEGFYDGPIWAAHRAAANDTMADSSDVLLLKPARTASGFQINSLNRPPLDAITNPGSLILATIYSFDAPVDEKFVAMFESEIVPAARAAGAKLLGHYVTESARNTFPRLPVREGENVFVWFASFADHGAYAAFRSSSRVSSNSEEVLELAPTSRSLLR
jgi:hypothetical protein